MNVIIRLTRIYENSYGYLINRIKYWRWEQNISYGYNIRENDYQNWIFFLIMYDIQHCFICRPSDTTVSEDAGIEPRTIATTALPVRRSNHSARSHPHSTRSHPHSARSHPQLSKQKKTTKDQEWFSCYLPRRWARRRTWPWRGPSTWGRSRNPDPALGFPSNNRILYSPDYYLKVNREYTVACQSL